MSQPINPYEPPRVLEEPQQIPGGNQLVFARPYQSARGKAKAVIIATGATMMLQVLLMVSFALQLAMLYGAKNGVQITPAAGQANDVRHYVIAGLAIVAALATLVALLVWIYAADANLPALGATQLQFTPGWSVGWFFVPILNLVRPYQVVREIWRQSDPATREGRLAAGTALIGWWWGLRIVDAIVGRVFSMISKQATTIDDFITISWVAIVLTLMIDLPLQLTQMLLVRTIQRFQDERHELVLRQIEAVPASAGTNPFAAPT